MGAPESDSAATRRSQSLLARYGGEHGPTGHASAGDSGEPVSLSSFIGGQAKAAPLGKLEGDGRTYTGESTSDDFQRLPGLANELSLASFLAKREQELHPELSRAATDAPAPATDAPAPSTDAPAPATDAPATATDKPRPPQRSTTGKEMVVLISGSGSNLQALIDATCGASPRIPQAYIGRVISNRKNAYGLERAKNVEPPIPTLVHSLKTYQTHNPGKTRDDYDLVLADKVLGDGRVPDLVVLAGFMHIVSETFLSAMGHVTSLENPPAFARRPSYPVPIINLHPALPGAFDGAHAIERAYDAFQKGQIEHTGVMVHEVVAEVDRGAPILVRPVPIQKDDSLDDLESRMHAVEHDILVEAVAEILAGTRTLTTAAPAPANSLHGSDTQFLRLDAQGHETPLTKPLVVYEDDIVWTQGSSPMLWLGRHATQPLPAQAQACVESGHIERQGLESAAFLQAAGGLLVTMLGARDAAPAARRLFVVRSDTDGTFIDEAPVCSASLCTAFSVVLLAPDGVHVWHGIGSDDVQQQRAVEWAERLAPKQRPIDTAALVALVGGGEMADGWHHRHRAALAPDARQPLLYAPASAPTPVPFAWARVPSDQVVLIDARLEIYVLVGAHARDDPAAYARALDRAAALATDARTGSISVPVHVLEAPSLVPLDLRVLARDTWNERVSIDDAMPPSLVLLRVRSLAEARAAPVEVRSGIAFQ